VPMVRPCRPPARRSSQSWGSISPPCRVRAARCAANASTGASAARTLPGCSDGRCSRAWRRWAGHGVKPLRAPGICPRAGEKPSTPPSRRKATPSEFTQDKDISLTQRPLGRTGLSIEPLVLGGNVFGWTLDEADSFAVLDAFVDNGFTMIDTADSYSKWVPGNKG